ncbi:MAG: diacylglycerol/lipid kinase family protein [Caldisericia bacterium]
MDYFFIVNPVAGMGKGLKVWEKLKDYLSKEKIKFEYKLTEYPKHATEIAKEIIKKGYKTLISVGGDGTIREVAEGIFDKDTLLGIIPAGRGRDLPRTLKLPKDPFEALKLILNNKKIIEIDHPIINEDRFVNFCGVGLDAEVAKVANTKYKIFGVLSYLFAFLEVLFKWKVPEFIIEIEGKIRKVKAYLITVANGKFAGGGMQISPVSNIEDGLLDIIIFHNMPKLKLFFNFPKVYFGGTHMKMKEVEHIRTKEIKIQFGEGIITQADGDLVNGTTKFFKIDGKKLKVFVSENYKNI